MDLIGKGYVIKYCRALLRKKNEDFLYRNYVTDALMALVNSGSKYQIDKRYTEILKESMQRTKEKTAEEIVADVMERAGLTINMEAK